MYELVHIYASSSVCCFAKLLSASPQLGVASGHVAWLPNALVAIVVVVAAAGIGCSVIHRQTHQQLRISLAALHSAASCVLQTTNWERCWDGAMRLILQPGRGAASCCHLLAALGTKI